MSEHKNSEPETKIVTMRKTRHHLRVKVLGLFVAALVLLVGAALVTVKVVHSPSQVATQTSPKKAKVKDTGSTGEVKNFKPTSGPELSPQQDPGSADVNTSIPPQYRNPDNTPQIVSTE